MNKRIRKKKAKRRQSLGPLTALTATEFANGICKPVSIQYESVQRMIELCREMNRAGKGRIEQPANDQIIAKELQAAEGRKDGIAKTKARIALWLTDEQDSPKAPRRD